MNPPVDAPTSSATSPRTSIPNTSSACASLTPPRDTYGIGADRSRSSAAGVDQIARLVDRPIARQHLAREDQRPRLLARRRQPLLDERQVGADPLGPRDPLPGALHGRSIRRGCKADLPA